MINEKWGDEWLSREAWEFMQIAVEIGGWPQDELCRRVELVGKNGAGKLVVGQILDILEQMEQEYKRERSKGV